MAADAVKTLPGLTVLVPDDSDTEHVACADPYIEFNSEVEALMSVLYYQRCQASELVE